MARVLITGGAGFIGSHLCDRLVARGDDVVVYDDLSLGNLANLATSSAKVQFIRDDLANLANHHAALADVHTIYHLAALISGYDSLHEPDAYVKANVGGMLRVIELAKRCSPCRIVFTSSSTVYGSQSKLPLSESTQPTPITVYALTKLMGEHLLSLYAGLHGFEHVSLRLFNVYGPRQNPNHPYANVTCKFAHAAANGTGVKLYGDGAQTRDFVYVDDVVDALLRVSGRTRHAVYNVGSGTEHSIAELLGLVQRLAGAKLPVEQCPPWPNDIRAIRADVTQMAQDHAWAPRVELPAGLEATIAHFRAAASAS